MNKASHSERISPLNHEINIGKYKHPHINQDFELKWTYHYREPKSISKGTQYFLSKTWYLPTPKKILGEINGCVYGTLGCFRGHMCKILDVTKQLKNLVMLSSSVMA
jgi:hypothetical protein